MPQMSSEYQCFKLDKDYFGQRKDLYICFVYHSPHTSTFSNNCNEDMLETVFSGLNKYSSDGDIFVVTLMPELNAMFQILLLMMMVCMCRFLAIICRVQI